MELQRSLMGRMMVVALIAAAVIITAVTAIVYRLAFTGVIELQIGDLESQAIARAHRQMAMFEQIEKAQAQSIKVFQQNLDLLDEAEAREILLRYFPEFGDGTRRSSNELFRGTTGPRGQAVYGMGGFVPRADEIDEQRLLNLIAAFQTVNQFGQSFEGQLPNTWFFSHAGDIIVFAPHRPDKLAPYRYELPADFDFSNQEVAIMGGHEQNPSRKMVCGRLSPMVFDEFGTILTSSCQTPVDEADGTPIGSFGITLPLTGWMNDTVRVAKDTNYRFVLVSEQTGLLAHTDLSQGGSPEDVLKFSEQENISMLIDRLEGPSGVMNSPDMDVIVAYATINGPGWRLLAIKDKTTAADRATRAAVRAATAMVMTVVLLIAVFCFLVVRMIARPLQRLARNSQRGIAGNRRVDAIAQRNDEIGLLAKALSERDRRVQGMVETLEQRVLERTEELERARREAEKANDAKSTFLATMSHEIRTPLNGVVGMAEALAQTDLDEEQKEFLGVMVRSGHTLLALIDDVLDISRIEAGKLLLDTANVDPSEIITDVCNLYRPVAARKGIELSTDLTAVQGLQIMTDPLRLRQILANLVSNAIKFTDEGHVRVKSSMGAPGTLAIEVEDTGTGISEDDQRKIFDKFQQAEQAISNHTGGAGLGLAICQELASLLGGELSVSSTLGAGATFKLTLRAMKPIEAAPSVAKELPTASGHADNFGVDGLRILVAEDLAVNRQVLGAICAPLGVSLTMAENGQEALDLLGHHAFDVVLMDLRMPVMDGLEATRRIRAGEAGDDAKDIPIIALTANAMREHVDESLSAGANAHVAKPVSRTALVAALHKHVIQQGSREPSAARHDSASA